MLPSVNKQWGSPTFSEPNHFVDFYLPIAYKKEVYAVIGNDLYTQNAEEPDNTSNIIEWIKGSSNTLKIRMATDKPSISAINIITLGM